MPAGITGHLLSKSFLEGRLRTAGTVDTRVWRRFVEARHLGEALGPASSLRAVLESGATPLVGAIGLRPIAAEHGNLGYWIGRPYWGCGYATAAARAVIALAFGLLDIDALTAPHLARNPASGRVMEKCGMSLLGTERRNHRGAEAEFCIREITRDDWERLLATNRA